MYPKTTLTALLSLVSALHAGSPGKLIFQDDFNRNESQETTDEIGNGWESNSAKRAAGNKQVDLRDGAMYIYIHAAADHAVSVTHPAEFQNGSVELRFMLENEDDNLGLNFADLQFKEVHAGHLFAAKITVSNVQIQDLKTGRMDLATRNARNAGTLSPEREEAIKTKEKKFPLPQKLDTGKWYALRVDVQGQTVAVSIEGQQVASFSSEGIAHPTKRMLRLAVPKNAVVDDLKIYAR